MINNNLLIILRTCDTVMAFSGGRPRDFGTKKEVIYKCCASIKKSIDYFKSKGGNCKLIIVDDHSSNETLQYLESLSPDLLVNLEIGGNGNSFKKCVELGRDHNDLVFLIEDDYLLKETCIYEMVDTHHKLEQQFKINCCLYPSDYPDRYTQIIYPSLIFLGNDRHWRTIKHTTCTFMLHGSIIREFEKELNKFSLYGKEPGITEDNTINLMYNKYYCISPIPSLGEHLQYKETLSPFYNIV